MDEFSAWKSGSCGSVKRPIGSVMLCEQRAVPAALRLPSRLSPVRVRKAGQEDRATVARLLFESAPDMYERFSGGPERALATLERAFETPGNLASMEVTWLAEADGQPAAAMAAFPVAEAAERSRVYMELTLRGTPFWRWPGVLRLYWVGGRASPTPRENSFYIDALATDPAFRRRGAARGLL